MQIIKGKYSEAIVYTDEIEQSAISQIYCFVNCKAFEGSKIRIMPDVHAGSGCVIGFTSTYSDKVVPNVVGVDLSCGVAGVNLGKIDNIDMLAFDVFIRENIPCGFTVREKPHKMASILNIDELSGVAKTTGQSLDYILASIGTLGGGNHFEELDVDDEGNTWFVVHTGSRNFGLKIANYFQSVAKSQMEHSKGTMNNLEYLTGSAMDDYLYASSVAYGFAELSRRIILTEVVNSFFKMNINKLTVIESLHNYIDIEHKIIRKGSVAAYSGNKLIIPWNMRDGTIIGVGKGNEDWNCSAPHGAGRIMGRGEAKRSLNVDDFKQSMEGIWSSCISHDTIDESPMVYKNPETIREYIKDSVEVTHTLKPIYNFKASDEGNRK